MTTNTVAVEHPSSARMTCALFTILCVTIFVSCGGASRPRSAPTSQSPSISSPTPSVADPLTEEVLRQIENRGWVDDGTHPLTNVDSAEQRLGWPLLRSVGGSFALDLFTAVLIAPGGGAPVAARMPYFTGNQWPERVLLLQAPESFRLPAPPTSALAEQVGPFEVIFWIRDDGSTGAKFLTGASAGSRPVLAFVNAGSLDEARAFLLSLALSQ